MGIKDREYIEAITADFETYSDFNFVSLFTWNVNRSASYSIIDNNISIALLDYNNKEILYSIFGKNIDKNCIDLIKQEHGINQLSLIPGVVANTMSKLGYVITEDRDDHDYIYDISTVIKLEGPKYRKFRRALSNFNSKNKSNFSWRKIEYKDKINIEKALDISLNWKKIRNRTFQESSYEYFAIKRAFKYAEELSLDIWGAFLADELVGFTITEVIGDHAILHFEKSDTRIPGLGYFTKYMTFVSLQKNNVKKLNYEQDLGIPGLRQAKMSMNPEKFLKKYSVSI